MSRTIASHTLRADLTAALTVALVGLPQCLAYALMSGLPPAYGLATAAVPGFVAAIAGKSPHVVTGPTNTTGLLILAALGPFLGDNGLLAPSGLGALATLALLAGVLRIAAALIGGAALVDFIPESVLAGFTAGAGVLIGMMQLDEALGVSGVRGGDLPSQLSDLLTAAQHGVAPLAIIVALVTAALIPLFKRWAPRIPMALVAVAAMTVVSMLLGLDRASGLPVVRDRAPVAEGWPPTALPDLSSDLVLGFIGPAAAIALLGTMELAVSARRGGARPDMRREISAQGLANIVGAFAGAFPASASLTRSALLELGGAKSRVAPAFAALVVVPILLFGGPFVAAMPQASLAGVLFAVAAGMVDIRRLRRMWLASPVTRTLLVVTFLATLLLPLEWAIFLGVGLGIAHHLATSRRPRIVRLGLDGRRLVVLPKDQDASTVVLEISGDCHFAATTFMLTACEAALPAKVDHVIVDLSHARTLRFAALLAFEKLSNEVKSRGGRLHLAGVDRDFCRLLRDTDADITATPYQAEPLASVFAVVDALAEGKPMPCCEDSPASQSPNRE